MKIAFVCLVAVGLLSATVADNATPAKAFSKVPPAKKKGTKAGGDACYDDAECKSGYCVVKSKDDSSGLCYLKDEAFGTVSSVTLASDSESASTNYYPGESEKVAEKELSDLPDDIKAMEQKDGCGEPGEPACDKSITDASGYGIDSDDDNTYTDTGKDGYGKKDKATSYHQPQVSSGKTERTDADMYASGEFGDKCGTSPVYGKGKYPGCPTGQYCNYEGGSYGLCTDCGGSSYAQFVTEMCEGRKNELAKKDCRAQCYTKAPTHAPTPYIADTKDTSVHTYDENLGPEPTSFPTYMKVVHVYAPPPPPAPVVVVHHVIVHHIYHTSYSPMYSGIHTPTVIHHFHYTSAPPVTYATTPYHITHTTMPYGVSHHIVPYVTPVMHTVIHHYSPLPTYTSAMHYSSAPVVVHHYTTAAPVVVHHMYTTTTHTTSYNTDGMLTQALSTGTSNSNSKSKSQHRTQLGNINRQNSDSDSNSNSDIISMVGAMCGVVGVGALAVVAGVMMTSMKKRSAATSVTYEKEVALGPPEPLSTYV